MAKLVFVDHNKEFELKDGESIIESCEKMGVPFACGYAGICGSCLIEVVEGAENLNELTQEEKDFLGEDEKKKRLACKCTIQKDIVKIKF